VATPDVSTRFIVVEVGYQLVVEVVYNNLPSNPRGKICSLGAVCLAGKKAVSEDSR
jgi:hypothetical protein